MFNIFKRIRKLEEEVKRLQNEERFLEEKYDIAIDQLRIRVSDLEKQYKLKKKGKKKNDKNIKQNYR